MIKTFPVRAIVMALSLSISVLLFSCGGTTGEAPQSAPLDVDFLVIQAGSTQIEKKYPGTVEGAVNVDIKAQVTGYLETVFVKEGDYVQKGQPLFRIKGEVFDQQVNNSRAAYDAALAAEKNAMIEVDKIRPLVEGKVYSELQLKTAQANLAAAKAQSSQARSALGSSQINEAFALIKAPVSGYISRIPNRIGNLVTPADATPLTTLSDIQQVFVYFSLSEADFISFMKESRTDSGMSSVELIMADGTVYGQLGKVEIASGNIDRTTGSISLKAIFPNPDKVLRSGGAGKIVMRKALNGAITIPMASVKDIQDRLFVFTLADSSKVRMKPIEVMGKAQAGYIVKSGLKVGDKIAINRIDALSDGTTVVPAQGTKTDKK